MVGGTTVNTLGSHAQGEMVSLVKWARWARVRYDGLASHGASLVEYVLLIGLVALVVIAGALLLGDSLVTKFSEFGSEVENAP